MPWALAETWTLAGFVAGALAGLGGALLRASVRRARERARESALPASASGAAGAGGPGPEAAFRRLRAADRWRVRQARRRERRAQRLLAMARCLIGGDERDLAARGTRAVVDDLGAEWASLWLPTGAGPVLLGSAARRGAAGPAAAALPPSGGAAGGAVHCLPLRDDGRRPLGLEGYAAFLGLLLAAELARSPAGSMAEGTGARAA